MQTELIVAVSERFRDADERGEAALRAVEVYPRIDWGRNPQGFLTRCARNRINDLKRRLAVQREAETAWGQRREVVADSPLAEAIRREEAQQVRAFVDSLGAKDRERAVLLALGLSQRQAALVTGESEGNFGRARERIARNARKFLRQAA